MILLTTHGMDEAEALCDRVGIISSGKLRCVGTPNYLKKKYGRGYTLTINTIATDTEEVARIDQFVCGEMSEGLGRLVHTVMYTRKYTLPKRIKVSTVFEQMEQAVRDGKVREWGISLTTLEDVFLAAVKEKNEV